MIVNRIHWFYTKNQGCFCLAACQEPTPGAEMPATVIDFVSAAEGTVVASVGAVASGAVVASVGTVVASVGAVVAGTVVSVADDSDDASAAELG